MTSHLPIRVRCRREEADQLRDDLYALVVQRLPDDDEVNRLLDELGDHLVTAIGLAQRLKSLEQPPT